MSENNAAVDDAAAPVGHSGARVQVEERPGALTSGWWGIGVVVICAVPRSCSARRPRRDGWPYRWSSARSS